MSKQQKLSKPKVFISHSHLDRHSATYLQAVLTQYGAETFLDQDRIQVADVLPDRIREGITWCNYFLLIWSANAASSDWVHREWDMAYEPEMKTKIIPYVLDHTSLPTTLEKLVHVDVHDQELGDSKLLLAIFGEAPFPGHWRASVDVAGMMQATYDLNLRANGQVEGEGSLSQSSVAGPFADQMGMGGLLTMRIPFHGSWSYNRKAQVLTLETSVSIMRQKQNETIRIRATEREKGAISGKDLGGRLWTLRRQTELGPETEKLELEQLYQKGIALWSGTGYSDPHLAIDYFTQAAHLDPHNAKTYQARGIAHHQLGLYREALADFNRSLSLYSGDPECHNWRGNTYIALNDISNAKKDWEIASEMGSTFALQNLRRLRAVEDVTQTPVPKKSTELNTYEFLVPKIEASRMSDDIRRMAKDMEERNMSPEMIKFMLSIYITGAFPKEVARHGKDYKTYTTPRLSDGELELEFLASPLPVYFNEQGRKLRTVRMQSRRAGEAWTPDPDETYIWENGDWEKTSLAC